MPSTPSSPRPGSRIETHGIDVIAEHERKGRPRDMFWPWAGSNMTILGVSTGAILWGLGLNLWQALGVSTVGVVLSMLVIGVESLSGQKGSAPTLVLSRAAFGVRGNGFSGVVGYLLMVGWETVGCSMAVLASRTVLARFGIHSFWTDLLVFGFIVLVGVSLAIYGFDAIMRAQKWIATSMLVMILLFMGLTWHHLDFHAMTQRHPGTLAGVVGGFVTVLSAFGIGWATAGADYSRYLPRDSSRAGNVFWTTFGGTVPIALLVSYGVLLAASNGELATSVANDPVGALTGMLPTWFLVPFLVVLVIGLMAGIPMDIYSSGLTLLAMGLPMRRWQAALVDGVMMTLGAIYVIWFAPNFLDPFEAFLYTLGVALSAWTGIYIADMCLRWRVGYDEHRLYDSSDAGYGRVVWPALLIALVSTVVGLGLVTSELSWLTWEGFLLGPLGLGGRDGSWAPASLGVLVALALSAVLYVAWWKLTRRSRTL